ncbi:MAG: putative porin [Bacteroidales bacterium]|nr:putative porin [Bacteroidales bacterium]
MKRAIYILTLMLFLNNNLILSQNSDTQSSTESLSSNDSGENPCIYQEQKTYAWRVTPTIGDMYRVGLDTLFLNYYNKDVEDSYSLSYNYLGNLGTPGESRVFSLRDNTPEFMFLKPYKYFYVSPENKTFYNTQIPLTQLSYLSGGSKINQEERFMANFAANVNKKLGVGTTFDYIYSRGFYNFQGVKNMSWQTYLSYVADKYQLNTYFSLGNYSNQENGGITEIDYILKPENVNANLSAPKNIPTNLENAWNTLKNKEFYLTQRYNIGFDRTYMVSETDSTEFKEFVPVTSFIHTLYLSSNKREFRINQGGILTENFFENTYLNNNSTLDSLSYFSLQNTFAISLNEGFNKYAKAGLSGFATIENRKYTNMIDSTDIGFIERSQSSNVLWVGGELSKQRGSILTYRVNAKFGLSGDNLGDLYLNGNVQTKIPLFKDSLIVRAKGHYKNIEPSYYMKHYISNHFKWSNNFNKEKRVGVYGELYLPYTSTTFEAGVENITKYLYFNNSSLAAQHDGNIQVLTAMLQQDFSFGIFNWNNSIAYQKTSNKTVLPLPDLSIYSQMYLRFKIAGVLDTQLGVDCRYFTKYYSQMYQPATQMFHTQDISQVGNYPLMNVFASMKLKKTRFFVMMYHVNKGLLGNNDYFAAPYYPLNPRVFKFGVSIDFAN